MDKSPENQHCPVCGFYCLGKGGAACIDKPALVARAALSEPVADEPVGYVDAGELRNIGVDGFEPTISKAPVSEWDVPLYTRPAPAPADHQAAVTSESVEPKAKAKRTAEGRADNPESPARSASADGGLMAESEEYPPLPVDDLATPSGGLEAGPEEERIEASYWRFDARRKGYGQWKQAPMSERAAFKAEMRNALGAEKVRAEMRLVGRGWRPVSDADRAQRVPLTDEQAAKLCAVGPVYAPDGFVNRTPIAYRRELQEAILRGFRLAERAYGIGAKP